MKQLLSSLSVLIVIGLFAFGFWIYDRRKKKTEKRKTSPFDLKPKEIHLSFEPGIAWNKLNLEKVRDWATENGARWIEGSEENAIIYFGESGKSQFTGFQRMTADLLPVRILLWNKSGR